MQREQQEENQVLLLVLVVSPSDVSNHQDEPTRHKTGLVCSLMLLQQCDPKNDPSLETNSQQCRTPPVPLLCCSSQCCLGRVQNQTCDSNRVTARLFTRNTTTVSWCKGIVQTQTKKDLADLVPVSVTDFLLKLETADVAVVGQHLMQGFVHDCLHQQLLSQHPLDGLGPHLLCSAAQVTPLLTNHTSTQVLV